VGALPDHTGATDTRIVAVQLSPIKHIANVVAVSSLIFADGGDIKGSSATPTTMRMTAVEGDGDVLRQKVDRQTPI